MPTIASPSPTTLRIPLVTCPLKSGGCKWIKFDLQDASKPKGSDTTGGIGDAAQSAGRVSSEHRGATQALFQDRPPALLASLDLEQHATLISAVTVAVPTLLPASCSLLASMRLLLRCRTMQRWRASRDANVHRWLSSEPSRRQLTSCANSNGSTIRSNEIQNHSWPASKWNGSCRMDQDDCKQHTLLALL